MRQGLLRADTEVGAGELGEASFLGAQRHRPDEVQARLGPQVGGGVQPHPEDLGELRQRQLVVRSTENERLTHLR